MGKQRHDIGNQKKLKRGKETAAPAPSLQGYARDLVARGLASPMILGQRSTISKR